MLQKSVFCRMGELTYTVRDESDRGMGNSQRQAIHKVDSPSNLLVKFMANTPENRTKVDGLMDIRRKLEQSSNLKYLAKAFPMDCVYSDASRSESAWCGFIMRDCSDDRSLNHLIIQTNCDEWFGEDTYRKMLRVCHSLCTCFDQLHQHELMVSDVKPDNFFVTQKGLVYPIDLDGFSVRGSYSQPPRPEYSNRDSIEPGFVPDEESENYGLAMMLLQILTGTESLRSDLARIREYDLEETGEEYDLFAKGSMRAIRNLKKRRFYPAWYILPRCMRDTFVALLTTPHASLPTPKAWMTMFFSYCRYSSHLDGLMYLPDKPYDEGKKQFLEDPDAENVGSKRDPGTKTPGTKISEVQNTQLKDGRSTWAWIVLSLGFVAAAALILLGLWQLFH